MQMFTPFAGAAAPSHHQSAAPSGKKAEAKDIDELKEQLRALQGRLDSMST
jgi:polyhydroxyalkanoate synthesis regulator protein